MSNFVLPPDVEEKVVLLVQRIMAFEKAHIDAHRAANDGMALLVLAEAHNRVAILYTGLAKKASAS